MKKAVITGITGQDGSRLVKFLLKKNYQVHGIKINSIYFRHTDVESLFGGSVKAKFGGSVKAKSKLRWFPKISFQQLVKEMIPEDLKIAKKRQIQKLKFLISKK